MERCSRLADELSSYLPAVLVSSSEPKTQATAAYLAQRWSIPYTLFAGLEEHHRRTAPFLSDELFSQTMHYFFVQPSELIFGEETADEAYNRFAATLDGLLVNYATQNLVVVTHGTVLSLFLSRRIGLEAFPFWKQLGLPSFVIVDRKTQSIETTMNIT